MPSCLTSRQGAINNYFKKLSVTCFLLLKFHDIGYNLLVVNLILLLPIINRVTKKYEPGMQPLNPIHLHCIHPLFLYPG